VSFRLCLLAAAVALPALPAPAQAAPPDGPAYVFPVRPVRLAHFSRAHHDYPATDIFAPCGKPYVAPTAGTVTELGTVDLWDPVVDDGATRGGLSVTLVGDDGVRYYGSHLRSVSSWLRPGTRVPVGEPLGNVGDTGSARGLGCHVHFGISPQCGVADDWWIRRGRLSPWSYLKAWARGHPVGPAPAVRRLGAGGCPVKPAG
jgi:murein DD-endopeptidase MepM/ murein hydrolase activator NlpD